MRSFSLALIGLIIWSGAAGAAPVIDPSAPNSVSVSHNSTGGSLAVTTTDTKDIIVIFIGSENWNLGTSALSVTGVSGGGLTWAKRKAFLAAASGSACGGNGANCGVNGEIWWAYASSALSAQTISWTWNGTVDCGGAVIFGVNGQTSNTAPWDSNASLTATASDMSGSNSQIAVPSVATTQSPDLALSFCVNNGANPCNGSPASGWTGITQTFANSSCTAFVSGKVAYKSLASPQSSSTVDIDGSVSNWVGLVDAITAASSCPQTLAMMGVGC